MKKVLWLQVCGLAAVQGAIALTWVIYNLYLAKLLIQFGFPAPLATVLLIIENLLAALMEPLMGSLSDRQQRWLGTRFPLIAFGVVAATATFIAIPVYATLGVGSIATSPLHWLFPGLLILWALAMTVFRSPVLCLLGRYAFDTHLPQAASILTLVGGLAGATGPLASGVILAQGPMVTFAVGSMTLLLAATVLQWVNPTTSPVYVHNGTPSGQDNSREGGMEVMPSQSPTLPWSRLIPQLSLVFGCGVGITLGFRLMMLVFPKIITTQVPDANPSLILGGIFLALACTAIPSGFLATRWGNTLSMAVGLGVMAVLMAVLLGVRDGWLASGVAIALGSAFSLVSNGSIPFALTTAPPERAGLGTGMYFSGGAIANSLFGAIFGQATNLSPSLGAVFGAMAFLGAGLCVMLCDRLKRL